MTMLIKGEVPVLNGLTPTVKYTLYYQQLQHQILPSIVQTAEFFQQETLVVGPTKKY